MAGQIIEEQIPGTIARTQQASKALEAPEQLSQLRTIAQAHLEEIDEDIDKERQEEARKQSELARYLKQKSTAATKPITDHALMTEKRASMRTAQDVLDRLQWDGSLDIDHYRVGYLERFDGLREMNASSWIKESTDEDWIPQHRIKYFKKIGVEGQDEIVWHRDERIDQIFGSTATS